MFELAECGDCTLLWMPSVSSLISPILTGSLPFSV